MRHLVSDDTQCDCGAFPKVIRIYFKGEDREARLCSKCAPDGVYTHIVVIDRGLETTSVCEAPFFMASQWSYMRDLVMQHATLDSDTPKKQDPWPQRTWVQQRLDRAMDSQARLWKRIFG